MQSPSKLKLFYTLTDNHNTMSQSAKGQTVSKEGTALFDEIFNYKVTSEQNQIVLLKIFAKFAGSDEQTGSYLIDTMQVKLMEKMPKLYSQDTEYFTIKKTKA